jgi:tight adherence protein B
MVQWLFIGGAVLAIVLLVMGLTARPAGQDLVEERIGGQKKEKRKKRDKKPGQPSALGAAVDRAVAGRGFAQNLSTQIARADLKFTVGEFLVLSVTAALGLSLIFYLIDRPILIPVGLIVGFFGPRWWVGFRQNARAKKFDDQLADALNLVVNSLRAGYSTNQAMEVISHEMPDPIATEFGRAVLEMQLGIDFDAAMLNMLRRMPSDDLDLVITAMSVQREVGGNLAEVLDSISFTIRERIRIKGDINTLTAQGRITGYIITFLPFGLSAFMYLARREFFGPMLEDPCGWIMLGTGLFMIIIGYVIINKIVNIEV